MLPGLAAFVVEANGKGIGAAASDPHLRAWRRKRSSDPHSDVSISLVSRAGPIALVLPAQAQWSRPNAGSARCAVAAA